MPPKLRDRLTHILDAIAQIEANTRGLSFDEFRADRFRQLGIERCIEIISEASRYLPDVVKARHPDVPWGRIGDIGNRLRHAYHAVDSALVWEIVRGELRDLHEVVNKIVEDADAEE
jgi:uncharacterized protein with HEPN domain